MSSLYTVCKDYRFAAAHTIRGHQGGCERMHGHSYRVRVCVRAERLDELGMVIDFADLKAIMAEVLEPFDHRVIDEIPPFDAVNPTAENLAAHVFAEIARRLDDGRLGLERVEVWENDDSCAVFRGG